VAERWIVRASRVLVALLLLCFAGSAGTYTLRWGDTLGSVAARFGVSVGGLAAANGIPDPNQVREGQVLRIPDGRVAVAVRPRSVHRVAAGETLGVIARRHGTSVARLVELNRLGNPNLIREGAVLQLDGAALWVCPVQGHVQFVSGFGEPRGGARRHLGVDIAAPRGRVVVANVGGVVEHHPNPRGGLAYYLHGDDGVLYYGAHLDSFVGAARRVRLGEAIGRVGDSGNSLGAITHLHFERMPGGGEEVDPMPLLRGACPTT
jgi:murein DD-endopeptidase MepM/ murein hydrolase activator NlpD